ncbi:cucumisin [Quercus suber]|uniref:Cucumisin n=1 Tax=Quercus suber TaxID=58331 RepID=A0AAW0JIH7_QUESU
MDGVVSVFPNQKKELHTTRSWDFLGLPKQVDRPTTESDVIIGVFDTGIWPESDSFNDKGFAKYYRSDRDFQKEDFRSPRDSDGHGTHVASIAAGNLVSKASVQGLGLGTARGGLPSARIAVYKVCWYFGCDDADILAAFDDAIADGVDIISISIGGSSDNYFIDTTAIGAFHAMRNGILTSTSAGNRGPYLATLSSFAPWSLSVAASTIDRKFYTKVRLGNNKIYEGISINTFDLKNESYPIIYGGDAPNKTEEYGKIVLCDAENDGVGQLLAGAVATVMQGRRPTSGAIAFPLPAAYLSLEDGADIYLYINSTRSPTATILKTDDRKDPFAPYIAEFSSRAAPGVDILAAWSPISPISPISNVNFDKRALSYNIISGTSMSCPHGSGVAAYIKSFHPTWSPAAIKSALMTTESSGAEFAYGAGNINPHKSANPGLIYDIDALDYIAFLCGQGYSTKLLQAVTGDNSSCPKGTNGKVFDLNYPSFALSTPSSNSISHVFNRTVTNIGTSTSIYKAKVSAPPGLSIKVNPSVQSFTSLKQKLSFALTIKGTIDRQIVSASLIWDDGTFQVRSPIVVYEAF